MLAQVTEQTVLHHDLYELAPALPSYVANTAAGSPAGPVVLIGDAAHAMTPDLGRGACEALVDGITVAERLVAEPTVDAALAAYDARRRPVTQRMARMSRAVNRLAHARRLVRLRDAGLRVALAAA